MCSSAHVHKVLDQTRKLVEAACNIPYPSDMGIDQAERDRRVCHKRTMVALLKEVGTTGAVLTWIKQHNLEAVEAFLAHPTLEEYRIQLPEKMRNQFYDANELWKTRVPTLQSVALEFVKLVKLRFEMVLSTEDFTEPPTVVRGGS